MEENNFYINKDESAKDLPLPKYMTEFASGMDLYANVFEPVKIPIGKIKLIPTGIKIILPKNFEAQVRSRSGLSLNSGIIVLNAPGTIDADYRGEVCVILANLSNELQTIENGERVCQMVVARHSTVQWVQVEELGATERGAGGFGHTGSK